MRQRRTAIGLLVLAALVASSLALGPGLLARAFASRATRALGTPVHLGWLSWNPLTGSWVIDGVRIAADRGPWALSARRVQARIDLWDLFRGRHRVRLLTVDGARVRLRATASGWELPLPSSAPTNDTAPFRPANFTLDWAAAPRAVVRLEPRHGVRSVLRLRQLELAGVAAADGMRATLWTRGRLDRGSIALVGGLRTGESSRRVRLRVSATALDLGRTLRLAAATPVRDLRGRIDLRGRYDESGPPGSVARRATGSLRGHDLALGAQGLDAIWLRDVAVPRFEVDLARRSIALGAVHAHAPEAWIRRSGTRLLLPGLPGLEAPAAHETATWALTVTSADVTDGTIHQLDVDQGGPPLDVSLSEAHVGRLAGRELPIPFSLAGTLGTGGRLSAEGEIVRSPPGGRGRIRVESLVLPPLLAASRAPLRLESGEVSGDVSGSYQEGSAELSGEITVSDVKSLPPEGAQPEDVLAFKEARLRLRSARTEPPSAAFEAIEISWPYVLIDRAASGIFPLSLVAATPASPALGPANLTIGRLRVIGGRIDFRDTMLAPPYWRALANLRLDARAVEAPAIRAAEVQATGLVDELSPLDVRGTIGARTHLVARVERLALPPFNAYLVEGALPYTVSSGLLSGRSEITLDRSQLEVDNRIVLSRLGLAQGREGDLVQREIGVPLTLALALMKDYRGNIELTLPFGGDLRDPSLHLRSVVLQAIVRAVRGAILSPLNALGRVLFRDGRIERVDLDPIPFPPARRDLDAAGRERVAQVARVLQSHPELGVGVRGTAATADLEHALDEAALAALVDAPGAEALRAFLRARLAGRPEPGLADADRARLEAVRATLPWPGATLQNLAVDRGAVAAASLIVDHHVEPGRVSAEEPEAPAPGSLAPEPGARVELRER